MVGTMTVSRRDRMGLVWVSAAAVLMVSLDLGRRILATNDEARFPLLAEDVLTRGAWLFPQLNGVAYNAKPPLLVWLIALASWPGGQVTQLTAALPSALAGVAMALVVYALGRALFGPTAGGFAALVAITTQGWYLHARIPMPDMVSTLAVTAAVAALWPMAGRRSGGWWLAFYGAMAVAFWTKGAVALLPLAVAVVWALADRQPDRWRALRLLPGLGLFAALIAPWWLGKLVAETEGMRDIVLRDNLLWYLPQSPAMLAGPPQHVVGILFPWALVAPLAAWQAVRAIRQARPERRALVFLFVWAGVLLLFLGVSEQQRLRYYLPLVPPAALALGWWGARATSVADERRLPWRVYAVAAAVVALATGLAVLIRPTWSTGSHVAFPTSPVETAALVLGLAVMLGAIAHGIRRGQLARVFAIACLGSAAWVAGWYHWELERRNAAYDYPGVRAQAQRLLPGSPVVATWGVYNLPLSFYFGRRVAAIATDEDLRRAMSEHPRASALVTEAALAGVSDRQGLRVVPLEPLDFRPVMLVSHRHDPARGRSPGAP
jgi:4-amino-4-deoxy-L-arabinose transferase-like glycosyltransferase